jgi:lactoylglutathione lyase
MKYCWCTLNVSDLDNAIEFYTDMIGLTVTSRFSPRLGMEIVFLKDEVGNEVELIKSPQPSEKVAHEGFSLGFEVSSLSAALDLAAAKGITVIEGPFITPKIKFFVVRDPDGFKVQIVEKTTI